MRRRRSGDRPAGAEVIGAAVVRDLIERNEQEIEVLGRTLEAALREAEEAEQRVAARSGGAPLPVPPDDGARGPGETAPGQRPEAAPRARTTVVTRPPT